MRLRDLPAAVHAQLVRRAAAVSTSLRSCMSELDARRAALPSTEQWLRAVRALGPSHQGGPTGSEAVAAGRAEDDGLVGR